MFSRFPDGTMLEVVQVLRPGKDVDIGAYCFVVDGKAEFPDMYKQFCDHCTVHGIMDAFDEFVWVKWDKTNKNWNGIIDGCYHHSWFKIASFGSNCNNGCGSSCGSCNKDDDCDGWCETTKKINVKGVNKDSGLLEPKGNDGRMFCFWCNTRTEKRGMWSEYDVCPKCGK